MSSTPFGHFLKEKKQQIDEELFKQVEALKVPDLLKDAMSYSLRSGGKRIRPILLLATMEAFSKDSTIGLSVGCAIEWVHTYSLIHDDLPAMDDDDLRRGQPTNHKVFGEAMAILAGDGLLTTSFGIIAEIDDPQLSDHLKVILIAGLAKAAGSEGMVAGQTEDFLAEGKCLSIDALEKIHLHKTGKLLSFAVEAGAQLAEATQDQILQMRRFSKHLGLAFQIRDDILDVEGSSAQLGKTPGSDESRQKSTYPQLLTLDGAKEKLASHYESAISALHAAGIQHEYLEYMAQYVVNRDR